MLQKYHSIFDGKLSKKVEATEAEAIGLPLGPPWVWQEAMGSPFLMYKLFVKIINIP